MNTSIRPLKTSTRKITCLLATLVFITPQIAVAQTWQLRSPSSDVSFTLKLLGGIQPKGTFDQLSGMMDFDSNNKNNSTLNINVKTSSLNIDLPKQFHTLAKGDFFQTKKYPHMQLASKRVRFYNDNQAKIVANLTFMGKTRPVLMDATIKPMRKNRVLYVHATTTIRRSDFDVSLPIIGVNDDIPIKIKAFLLPKK